jgi:hypothetical protein
MYKVENIGSVEKGFSSVVFEWFKGKWFISLMWVGYRCLFFIHVFGRLSINHSDLWTLLLLFAAGGTLPRELGYLQIL